MSIASMSFQSLLSRPSNRQLLIPFFLSSFINFSDNACICLAELPLAIIIKSAIEVLFFKFTDFISKGIKNIITFGLSKKCDVRLVSYKYKNKNSCKVFLEVLGKRISFYLNNLGDHWIENSLAITSIIVSLNKDISSYIKKISKFSAVEGRGKILNVQYNRKKITLIDDSYNSSPESLKASIIFLNRLGNKRRKICVLGDMYELGKFSKRFHLNIKKISDSIKSMPKIEEISLNFR